MRELHQWGWKAAEIIVGYDERIETAEQMKVVGQFAELVVRQLEMLQNWESAANFRGHRFQFRPFNGERIEFGAQLLD